MEIRCGASTTLAPNPVKKKNAQMLIAQSGRLDLFDLIRDQIAKDAADWKGRTVLRYAYLGKVENSSQKEKADPTLVNHASIIAELEKLTLSLNSKGCEYFDGHAETQSVPNEYITFVYTDTGYEAAKREWDAHRRQLQNTNLVQDHQFGRTVEELHALATDRAMQTCHEAGFSTCEVSNTRYLPKEWGAKENPATTASLRSSLARVGLDDLMFGFRQLEVAASVTGLEEHGNEFNCFVRDRNQGSVIH